MTMTMAVTMSLSERGGSLVTVSVITCLHGSRHESEGNCESQSSDVPHFCLKVVSFVRVENVKIVWLIA